MKVDYLPRALKALEDAPAGVRKAFSNRFSTLKTIFTIPHCTLRNMTNPKTVGKRA
jgi:hypothetical protein